MQTRRNRNRNGRERLQRLAMIGVLSISFAVGLSAGPTALADSRERSAAEQDARSANRGERAEGTGRRGGSRPAATASEAPGRSARSMPAPAPPVTPVPAPTRDATNDAVVEAAKARAEQMQALSETHAREMAEDAQRFQERMRAATTPAERTTLQQEFQRERARKSEDFQQRMRALQQD